MPSGSLNYVRRIGEKEIAIEWTIPNFFSEEEQCWLVAESPVFHYFNIDWFMEMDKRDGGYLVLGVYKPRVNPRRPWVYYAIGVKKTDGTVYKYQSGKKPVNDILGLCETEQLVLLPDLFRDKGEIASQNALVVFCNLSLKENNCLRGVTKNESAQTDNSYDDCKLSSDLQNLFLEERHFDTSVQIEDKVFKVHRAILVARSSVFNRMFTHDTTELKTGEIKIHDCDPEVFQDFLFFLYTGKMKKLSSENILMLYTLSDKYDVQDMREECVNFMMHNVSVDNFCDFADIAIRHNEQHLLKAATYFFTKNTMEIIVSAKWQCFHKQYPVESNELYIKAIKYRDEP